MRRSGTLLALLGSVYTLVSGAFVLPMAYQWVRAARELSDFWGFGEPDGPVLTPAWIALAGSLAALALSVQLVRRYARPLALAVMGLAATAAIAAMYVTGVAIHVARLACIGSTAVAFAGALLAVLDARGDDPAAT